jgi:hypothetical protein
MKKKVLLVGGIAAAAVLAAGLAVAQPFASGGFGYPFMWGHGFAMGPGMMRGMGFGMHPGMMHGAPGLAFTDPAQIDSLKNDLAITSAQEPAWTKYTKAVQDAQAAMKSAHEGIDPTSISKMSVQDRFTFMTSMREQGQKQFEAVQTAANELLATLDESQKSKATNSLPGLISFGPGSMHGLGMMGP